MGLEAGNSRPDGLNIAWPLGSDSPSQGDDHVRLVKDALKTWSGAAGQNASLVAYLNTNYATVSALATTDGNVTTNATNITTNKNDIDTINGGTGTRTEKAPLASPNFTGTPQVASSNIVTAANYVSELRPVIHTHAGGNLDAGQHRGKFIVCTGDAAVINLADNDRLDFFNNSGGNITISGFTGLRGNGATGTQVVLPATFGCTVVVETGALMYLIGAGTVS